MLAQEFYRWLKELSKRRQEISLAVKECSNLFGIDSGLLEIPPFKVSASGNRVIWHKANGVLYIPFKFRHREKVDVMESISACLLPHFSLLALWYKCSGFTYKDYWMTTILQAYIFGKVCDYPELLIAIENSLKSEFTKEHISYILRTTTFDKAILRLNRFKESSL